MITGKMSYLSYAIKALNPKKFYYIINASLYSSLNKKNPVYSNDKHVHAAVEWLMNAQKANNDGGVSAMYSLFDGWHESYVETTGYIIPTIFNYAEYSKNEACRKKAVEMADFELNSQLASGAFPGGGKKDLPIVFNTGQVIFGIMNDAGLHVLDSRSHDDVRAAVHLGVPQHGKLIQVGLGARLHHFLHRRLALGNHHRLQGLGLALQTLVA